VTEGSVARGPPETGREGAGCRAVGRLAARFAMGASSLGFAGDQAAAQLR